MGQNRPRKVGCKIRWFIRQKLSPVANALSAGYFFGEVGQPFTVLGSFLLDRAQVEFFP